MSIENTTAKSSREVCLFFICELMNQKSPEEAEKGMKSNLIYNCLFLQLVHPCF